MLTRHLSFYLSVCLLLSALLVPVGMQALPLVGGGFAGVVRDLVTERPISGVTISAAGQTTRTDAQGRYVLALGEGVYAVRAEAPGYIGMTHTRRALTAGEHRDLPFEMIPVNPSEEEQAIIDAKLMLSSQEPPDEESVRLWGYGLSNVTAAPSVVRVLMPDGSVVPMPMDEYLKGVVPAEMPPSWPMEALKAQAVAARCYAAVRAEVCVTEACQVWRSTHYDTTDRAVDETRTVVATYAGVVISALYSSHCDGHTRNSEDVWGGYLPYCRSVECPCGFTERKGHGVGMCQYGARALAIQGNTYDRILKHYYTGIELSGQLPGRIVRATLQPLSGDTTTEFVYEAIYASPTGELPAQVSVIVDGHARALTRVAGGSATEMHYRLTTRLAAGEHTFRFYVDDGYGNVSTAPIMGTFTGPAVAAAPPKTPTPTPSPQGVQATSILHSTSADWSSGQFQDVELAAVGDGALSLVEGAPRGAFTSAPITAPLSYTALGVLWLARTPQQSWVGLDIRHSDDGQSWSAWQAVWPSDDLGSRGNLRIADPLFGLGRIVQYRLRLERGSGASPIVESVQLAFIDSSTGPRAAQLTQERAQASPSSSPVIAREAWGAQEGPVVWQPEYRPMRALVIHHSGAEANGIDPAAMVRALHYYQAIVLERGDIGYQYLIDPLGNIYEGRAGGAGVVGAHAGRFDWSTVGIALLGDYTTQEPAQAMQVSLANLAARFCAQHGIDPAAIQPLVDLSLPTIIGHRHTESTNCPGNGVVNLLPSLRARVQQMLPTLPGEHRTVRGVLPLSLRPTTVISSVQYYVDGDLRATASAPPFLWKWNTVEEDEGLHVLRIVSLGSGEPLTQELPLIVDNTPPSGWVEAASWYNTTDITLTVHSPDAQAVQLSNGWVWQGETLYHSIDSGRVVTDAAASNGLAWLGQAGVDGPGDWYGPYTCDLPPWNNYRVCFRVKTNDRGAQEPLRLSQNVILSGGEESPLSITETLRFAQGDDARGSSNHAPLAKLDVADVQGQRIYAQKLLYADDFPRAGEYEEICLDLFYQSAWPTCLDGDLSDGLEFRVAYTALGDLYLDRVALFSSPQSLIAPLRWRAQEIEGEQQVIARLLDAAGNALDVPITVRLDWTAPQWFDYQANSVQVQDALSGLDTTALAWSASADGGHTWGEWSALAIGAAQGITAPLHVALPTAQGTHLRLRARDMAGNLSLSQAISLTGTTPTLPPTPLPTVPTATPAPYRLLLPLTLKGQQG